MQTGQWETGAFVVKGYILPSARVMTCAAVCAIFSLVIILRGMTRIAILWRALVNSIDMAIGALDLGMQVGQFEISGVVIESYIFPITGDVAFGAIRAHLPIMKIILLVARDTIFWRAFEFIVYMALRAFNSCVRAIQLKF